MMTTAVLPDHPAEAVTLFPAQPTQRRGVRQATLRPGVIDDDVREFFSFGYCHLLACALHEVTGWPFGVVEQDTWRDGKWKWVHVGVLTPAGGLLDIQGDRHPAEAVRERQELFGGSFRLTKMATVRDLYRAFGLPESTPDWWWSREFEAPGTAAIRRLANDLLGRVEAEVAA